MNEIMKIVLHICCAVCAAGTAERLISEGHQIIGFFYNPNIYPPEEYNRRLEATRQVAEELRFRLEAGPYATDEWFKETNLWQNEPEGGRRCEVCFRHRLEKAYFYMREREWDVFTTTLTIGPRKPARLINQIGQSIGGGQFLVGDFKKKDGFKRAIELARKWDLYRQDYCGCIYSMRRKA